MLCCNDDSGNFAGTIGRVQLSDAETLNLEDFVVDEHDNLVAETPMEVAEDLSWIKIGECQIAIRGYSTWVGNIYWDCVSTPLKEALTLINYLQSTGRWFCEEAEETLYWRWNASEPLTEHDLAIALGLIEGAKS